MDASAAAKSYLWLLIADQGLITLINDGGIWGPDMWSFYQYHCSLKGPVGGLRSVLSPVGAIPGLTADTSQMDPVASVQGGVSGERDICYFHK